MCLQVLFVCLCYFRSDNIPAEDLRVIQIEGSSIPSNRTSPTCSHLMSLWPRSTTICHVWWESPTWSGVGNIILTVVRESHKL